jgi:alcohol dehydrogenase
MSMKMRAAVLYEQGRQPPFTESRPLVVEDVELDEPGPGEVLVEIAAAGLCHSDLSAIVGDRPRAVPAVVGHEAAGVVEAVGPGVEHLAIGDHVVMVFVASCGICEYCSEGRPNLCQSSWAARGNGTLQTGVRRLSVGGEPLHHWSGISAFAEHAVVVPASLVKIDDDVPLEIAAIFGCAVATGVGAVLNTARVPAGATVAVVGLGGVGLSALLGAGAAGAARLAAIDTNPAKLELAAELGATDVFDARDPDCAAQLRDRFRGGASYVIEAAGAAAAVELACAVTARGGTTVTAGLPHPSQQLRVPLAALVSDERTVRGSYMGSCVPRRDIPRYIDLYRRGKLPVDRLRSGTVTLDELNAGFDRLARGETVRDILVP